MNHLRKRRFLIVAIVFVLTICLGIGYAVLSAHLTVSGTNIIQQMEWDIHFENYQRTVNSTITPASGKAPDTSGNNKTSVSYEVEFEKPGDIYEFTIDIKNAGTIDAMIENFQTKIKIDDGAEEVLTSSNLPSYMIYSLTYSDGIELASSQLIKASKKETLLVHVEFIKDITEEQFQAAKNKTIKFTFDLNCVQANNNAVIVDHNSIIDYTQPVYVVSNIEMNRGQIVPEGVLLRSTPEQAMHDWLDFADQEYPFYLKLYFDSDHKIALGAFEVIYTVQGLDANENPVSNTQIFEFKMGDNMGGKHSYYQYDLNMLYSFCGFSNGMGGSNEVDENGEYYYCSEESFSVGMNDKMIRFGNNAHACQLNDAGSIKCN